MRRIIFLSALSCLITAFLLFFAWSLKSSIAAQLLSHDLHVDVSIDSLNLTRKNAKINNLKIGNPPHFTSPFSCTTGLIDIVSSIQQIRSNPLIIDEIVMQDIWINLESRKDGLTNWNQILSGKKKSSKSERHYLIKSLTLLNLNVQVTQADGKVKSYPAIEQMHFENISDETGFPLHDIEKAIFNKVIQNLYQNLNLDKIFQPLVPGIKNIPSGILPSFFSQESNE